MVAQPFLFLLVIVKETGLSHSRQSFIIIFTPYGNKTSLQFSLKTYISLSILFPYMLIVAIATIGWPLSRWQDAKEGFCCILYPKNCAARLNHSVGSSLSNVKILIFPFWMRKLVDHLQPPHNSIVMS